MKLKFVLPLLLVTALASAAATSFRSSAQVTALKAQVQKLEAALGQTQRPEAVASAREEKITKLGYERQAILRTRTEFLKTLKPTHPDVLYLDKKLAVVEELLISAELSYIKK